MRKSNFALRLQPSLLAEARKVAEAEGVALNQLINVALAEKLSALRTASNFAERAARANIPEAQRILDWAGVGQQRRRTARSGADATCISAKSGYFMIFPAERSKYRHG